MCHPVHIAQLTLSGIAEAFTRTEPAEPGSALGRRSVLVTGDGEVAGPRALGGGCSGELTRGFKW